MQWVSPTSKRTMGFYSKLGARSLPEWTLFRMEKSEIDELCLEKCKLEDERTYEWKSLKQISVILEEFFDVLYTLFILRFKFRFVLLYSQDFAKFFSYLAKTSRWSCLMSFTLSTLFANLNLRFKDVLYFCQVIF